MRLFSRPSTRRFLCAALLLGGLFAFFGGVARAANVNLGLTPEVEGALGLGTTDIRVTIATIIRNFMALLGVVAVLLVLYGGFLYMTASGNEDQIEKAKKVIASAIIGLAVILSAVAITQFILSSLGSATGLNNGGSFGGAGGGGGLPIGSFYIQDISPSAAVPIRNVVVRVIFSRPVDATTVANNVSVTGPSGAVSGTLVVKGTVVEFTPTAACPDPNAALFCFDASTTFTVTVTTGIKSNTAQTLNCGGIAPVCSATFATGDLIDVAPPSVAAILSPNDGQSVPVDTVTDIQVHAVDDAAISYVDVSVDGTSVGQASPGSVLADFTGGTTWDTTGVSLGNHSLSARAYDVDSNSTVSPTVTVTVRPLFCFNAVQDGDEAGVDCGGSCGACAGGACTQNSDCASGVCENNVCIARPRIDAVTPINGGNAPSGAPGTLVTLSGAFFGGSAGTVTFLGSSSSTQQTAQLCDAVAWSDNEITVVVPANAANGALLVSASNGQQDATNDTRGPLINDFVVTNQVHPGICHLSPTSGEAGTGFALSGSGFGTSQGNSSVLFTLNGQDTGVGAVDLANWTDTSITTNVPTLNVSVAQSVPVRVAAGGVDSNSKAFLLEPLGASKTPRVDLVSPTQGPIGQYVTLSGQHFGTKIGTVLFALPDGTTAIGDTTFPAACGTGYWTDEAVTVKVPAFYKDGTTPIQQVAHTVRVRRADSVESNTQPFTVISGVAGPGICALLPDNGPALMKVDIVGEHFGSILGSVLFQNNQSATPSGNWSDQLVGKVVVPAGAQTGGVVVATAQDTSNAVPFFVGSCTSSSQCAVGESCCGDGSCRLSCSGVATSGGYAWRFSTGEIPHLPHVVEQLECTNTTQSPSPYKGSLDACTNAWISARITADMDDPSLLSNFFVYPCGTGQTFDASTCNYNAPVIGDPIQPITVTPSAADEDLVTFIPQDPLVAATWYDVLIKSGSPTGTKSIDGLFLDGDFDGVEGGDYRWHFRVREDATVCTVDHVEVTPGDYVLTKKEATIDYLASPTAANCNQLDCTAYTWAWSSLFPDLSDGSAYGLLSPVPGSPLACTQRATAKLETPPGKPLHETATIPSLQKSDYGVLAISYLKPEVASYWPNCTGACVNAGIGATFNVGMDPTTINANTVRFCTCTDESCSTFSSCTDPSTVTVMQDTNAQNEVIGFHFAGYPLLTKQTWYRAFVDGGASGVRSESASTLIGLNYGSSFSWVFRTRDDGALCDVDRVTISPEDATVYVVGDTQTYTATPWSKDDGKCGATPLVGTTYPWSWNTSNVAALSQVPGGNAGQPPQEQIATLDWNGLADFLPLTKVGIANDGLGCLPMCLQSGSTAGDSVCSNGVVEKGEDCDDGNTVSGDGCSSICLAEGSTGGAVCGNSVLEKGTPGSNQGVRGENCDDGNAQSGDGCSALCLAEGSGSGAVGCGNGAIDIGENCDDGNQASFDGCSQKCTLEGAVPGVAKCGNVILEKGEACDDGNTANGDGCSSLCLHEGSGKAPACGNGILQTGEACDDGNIANGDGCSAACLYEGGAAGCGNGLLDISVEACDDGNTTNGDGCSAACLAEGSTGGAVCGNGVVEKGTAGSVQGPRGELCDDSNTTNGDGCSASCLPEGTTALSVCGNGILEAKDEACDDGNTTNGDGCSAACLAEGTVAVGSICGSGDVGKGETCDDSNTYSGDGCSAHCLREGSSGPHPVCGNNVVEAGENCDDGNSVSGDGCSSICLAEGTKACVSANATLCCGNTIVDSGETCDDGNAVAGDGCSSICLAEGSHAHYDLFLQNRSYCGNVDIQQPPFPFGTGEMCEFPNAGDTRVDPQQFVRAAFGGTSDVSASVQNTATGDTVSGNSTFNLLCNCASDGMCSLLVPNASQYTAGLGCGLGRCCFIRPLVDPSLSAPSVGETSVCRNALVAAHFDQLMDTKTLASSTLLLAKKANVALPCALGLALPLTSTLPVVNTDYCLATSTPSALYTVSGVNTTNALGGVQTEARFNLKAPLDPNLTYGVLVIGDHDTVDALKEGVQSASKVSMANDYFWSFTTGATICKVDHVTVTPDTWLFSTAQNDVSDDAQLNNPQFDQVADSDKQFLAEAWGKSANGTEEKLSPTTGYTWDWDWVSSDVNQKSIALPTPANIETQLIQTVPSPVSGNVTLTPVATVTEDVFGAACAVDSDCGKGLLCHPSATGNRCAGQQFSAAAALTVLLCENPWPVRAQDGAWSPYLAPGDSTNSTNFSVYYCRDAGRQDDTSDDLPAPISEQGVTISHPSSDLVCSNNPTKVCAVDADCGGQNSVCQQRVLLDLLFPLDCSAGNCNNGDAFGFRVLPNLPHDTLKKWYGLQGFGGAPSGITVDGYSALKDEQTVYASVVNKIGDPELYSNVYVLSYNQGAAPATKEISSAVQSNWQFNTNVAGSGLCVASACTLDTQQTCVTDADCGTDKGLCKPISCTLDAECSGGAGGICSALKQKMQRDLRRLEDFRHIETSLEAIRTSTLHCSTTDRACLVDQNCPLGEYCIGEYPTLSSGTFVPGVSVSAWDSWQNTFGQTVKDAALPKDPLNTLVCDTASGYDATTCFKNSDFSYQCLPGSHVYQYRKEAKTYRLSADFEYKFCSNDETRACLSDSDCLNGGGCVTPTWKGIGPLAHDAYDAGFNATFSYQNIWDFYGACQGVVLGAGQPICGNGIVEQGEDCEIGQKQFQGCTDPNNGYPGYVVQACGTNNGQECKWLTVAVPQDCNAASCGDGIVQAPPLEYCDDGSLNDTYGHCASSCKGPALAGHCGDAQVQGGETCDKGGYCKFNPVNPCANDAACGVNDWCVGANKYGGNASDASCSFDCKKVGPYCGDKIVQPEFQEQCDGNSETDTAYCPVCPDPATLSLAQLQSDQYKNCTNQTIGRSQVRTRGCSTQPNTFCFWNAWTDCTPVGLCGDGVLDPGEACDDGNDINTDGCIIIKKLDPATNTMVVDQAKSCKKAQCGDGFIAAGIEACDAGTQNVNPSDATAINNITNACSYGKTCQFCTSSCTVSSVSGGYCGDLKVTPAYEACEAGLGAANDPAVDASYPGVAQLCYPNCQAYCPPAMTNSPNFQFAQTKQSPIYLDQIDNMHDNETWQLVIPPCRYLSSIAADINFTQAAPPDTAVVIVFDLSKSMNQTLTYTGQSKLAAGKKFATDLINALQTQFASHPGKLKIAMFQVGGIDPAFPEISDTQNVIGYQNGTCHSNVVSVPDDCSTLQTWAKKVGNAAVPDANGYCYMEQRFANYNQVNGISTQKFFEYSCQIIRTLRGPNIALNPPSDFATSNNFGALLNEINSPAFVPTVSVVDYPEAVVQARELLDSSGAGRKIMVKIHDLGDDDNGNPAEIDSINFCGGGNGVTKFEFMLNLSNNPDQGACGADELCSGLPGESCDTTQYDFIYTEASTLVQQLTQKVNTVYLTLGNNSAALDSFGTVQLPTSGIMCGSSEKRVNLKMNWGGGGVVQIKNATPSYCPLVPGSVPYASGVQIYNNPFLFQALLNLFP
jgi:cysteine-rich repeat protein